MTAIEGMTWLAAIAFGAPLVAWVGAHVVVELMFSIWR